MASASQTATTTARRGQARRPRRGVAARSARRTAMPVLRSRLRAAGGARRRGSCSMRALGEPLDGDVAVDLAAALAAQPAHPDHRHTSPRRRHQPQQDLHAPRGGTPGRRTRVSHAERSRHDRAVTACRPTPRSPSANTWCFQIGTSALRGSISAREARRTPRRGAPAVVATTTARSPMLERARPGAPRRRRGRRTPRRPARRPRAAGRARSGGRSSPGRSTPLAAVVVADRADEERQAPGGGVVERGRAPRRRRAGSRGGRPGGRRCGGHGGGQRTPSMAARACPVTWAHE